MLHAAGRWVFGLLVALLLASLPETSIRAQQLEVRDLGTLGGHESAAAALNSRGQVAGWSATASGEIRAFLHDGTRMHDLGTLGGGRSAATALNDAGQVAGWSETAAGEVHAFLHDGALMRDLGTLGGSESIPVALNARGQVAGWSETAAGEVHAFLHDGSGMRDLGTLGGSSSAAAALNDSGQVAGWALDADGGTRAFLFDGVALLDLGTLGGAASEALDLNAAGQVVGRYVITAPHPGNGEITRAFLFDGVQMRDLGTLGGEESTAVAINDAGAVVGWSDLAAGYLDTHAFLFDGAQLHDLGTLGGDESEAIEVNALGQVLGMADTGQEPSPYRWVLWSGGQATDLVALLLEAGFPDTGGLTLHLGDAGAVAGTARTATGERRAVLLAPATSLRLRLRVRPASPDGTVNPESQGVVKVAVLAEPALPVWGLVERSSLRFGASGTEDSRVDCLPAPQDVDGDGLGDLVCHFATARAGLAAGGGACRLTGRLTDGRPLLAEGTVRLVPH